MATAIKGNDKEDYWGREAEGAVESPGGPRAGGGRDRVVRDGFPEKGAG